MKLSGWGCFPVIEGRLDAPRTFSAVQRLLGEPGGYRGIARGLGRSYGDSALAPRLLASRHLDQVLALDARQGRVRCAAGVSLADLLTLLVPRGWFLPVTPGTKFVTVGGAIAADVHGKNHHLEGSFGDHVESLRLALPGGEALTCSRAEHSELFHATCGGMGLTGVILEATFRLKPIRSAFIEETTVRAAYLEEALTLFDEHAAAPYSVAWIDCLARGARMGRSLLMCGRHAEEGALRPGGGRGLRVPMEMPDFLLGSGSMRLFNTLYYHRVRGRVTQRTVHYEPFFYPLDALRDWNLIYGRRGFLQYQFVVPKAAGAVAMADILGHIARSGRGSFLAVLKAFGAHNQNLLSFPREGYTLALDFKMGDGLLEFLGELDRRVVDHGGRIYLAKDARMGEAVFKAGYPLWERFAEVRGRHGAEGCCASLQSQRLGL